MSNPEGFGWRDVDATAACDLAAMISERVPGWSRLHPEAGLWAWTDPDPAFDRAITLDGREREVQDPSPSGLAGVFPPPEGRRFGPTLTARSMGLLVVITLPDVTDRGEMRSALEALAAIGALPLGDTRGTSST